ncbi:hypothetical protein DICPUDRAFT_82068 [Dictyostelium purpureum]|uniref:Rho-GAP domain-containing protein n=1 Tax=Dictyostelium purpureum TaxID=5786 RepID=F0ZVF1_DICPU|nr:uncharacterized protein DICPUDRAFT_82068 [Dictyostelium purpureum]EGC32076.1 hypothetical protein DICPUDRAFT_82068 [Dictyostelium purpureum]|eukprot:XP_003291399.1 hypothetical protein DICPUDRAFT_82068 [Dictyostelium purpureum]
MSVNKNKAISGPISGSFLHVGGSNVKPAPLQAPPPLLKVPPQINNNTNNDSPPKSPHLTKSVSNSNLGGTLHLNGSNNKTPPIIQPTHNILHHPSPKKSTKSTIISGKLKRFFKSRPSRDSLYEKHILSAPFGSGTLSFINIFKIITALKKSNALENEGLFRVNGNAESIRSLWLMLNNIHDPIPSTTSNPHDLAGLLKLYLRETKFPLVPLELCSPLPVTADEARDFMQNKLPSENLRVLSYLMEYLEQVSTKSSINKMNPIALGVCFAPNTIRSVNTNNSNPQFQIHMTNIQSHCNFITLLIENRGYIFNESVLDLPPPPPSDDCPEILESLIPESIEESNDLYPDSNQQQNQQNQNSHDHQQNHNDSNEDYQDDEDSNNNNNNDGENSPSQKISPLYDEFINLLTDDSLGPQQKSIIISRMTNLFYNDGENFKKFLKEMGIDGIVSLLEYILTLDDN